MRARTHLMRLQRALYDRLRGYAHRLGRLTPELRKYFQEYQRDFQDFREVSTKRDLLAALQKTHITFCGDYHTLSQAQKTVIRVLRDSVLALKKRDRTLVLALEMVQARHNAKIQRFLDGGMSEAQFLKSIGFHRNWGFSWDNYRRLFQFAKEHRIRVVGINCARKDRYPTLRERDRYAAQIIADLTERDPKTLVFVLVGDLHLAASHLPGEVDKQLKRRKLVRKRVVILQNNERFYWKLVALGLEQLVDVVKVKENVYCVLNTPPWVKLKSHLRWTEVMAEAAPQATGPQSGAIDVAELLHEVEYADEIREILEVVQKFIGIEAPPDDDFTVNTPADMSFLNRIEKDRAFTAVERAILRECLGTFESHFVPRENVLYLTSLSLNHAATQAAIYLHAKTSGFRRVFASPPRDFYTFLWVEALGFLGSKIINHKRKCDGPKDLERIAMKKKGKKREIEVAKAVLAHLAAETRFGMKPGKRFEGAAFAKGPSPARRVIFHYLVAKRLGALLGNALYDAAMDGRVERSELCALFENDFPATSARKLYLEWIGRLDAHGYRRVVKTERL